VDNNFNEKIKELMNDDPTIEPINDIYQQHFEIKYLQDADDFYRQQNIPTFESNVTHEYLITVTFLN
jgi:hypothetical protein